MSTELPVYPMSEPPAEPTINYESILNSIKKVRGVHPTDTSFDPDIIMAINSAFSTLCQLGVGPRQQFRIQDANAQWSEFFGTETNIDSVKDYINLRVALIFDLNAATSYVIQARERQVKELEWRLSVEADRLYFAPDIIDGAEDMG